MKIVQVRTIFIWHQCNNYLFQRNLIGVLKLSVCDCRTGRECRAEDWADANDGCGESRNYCGVDMCSAGKSTSNLQVLLRFIYIHDLCKICEHFTENCLGAVWVFFLWKFFFEDVFIRSLEPQDRYVGIYTWSLQIRLNTMFIQCYKFLNHLCSPSNCKLSMVNVKFTFSWRT